MWFCVLCLIPIFVSHSSTNDDSERYKCGTSLLHLEKHDDVPAFDQSKYIADDPTTYKPFKIHFVIQQGLSQKMQRKLDEITAYTNRQVSGMMKTRPLDDVRKTRTWNSTSGKCDAPTCLFADVPGEYAFPCRRPNQSDIVPEDGVPAVPTDKIAKLNAAKDISLVLYVEAEMPKCRLPGMGAVVAFAESCERGHNNRPTHGYVGICASADDLVGEKAKRVILHEMFHIVLSNSIVGFGAPTLGCMPQRAGQEIPLPCENVTYKAVREEWVQQNGTRTNRTKFLVTTKNVKRAVQEYFRCDSVEGAEIQAFSVSDEESKEFNGTVPEGTPYPGVHWNEYLFPDEIMNTYASGAMKFSALTLGLLMDLGWYEVNESAIEPMQTTRPTERGCEIANNSCEDNIRRGRKENKGKVHRLPSSMGPYCDRDYKDTDRIVTVQCINDREPLMCPGMRAADAFHGKCGVVHRPPYYSSFACDQSSILRHEPVELGGKVGPGTICVTIGPVFIPTFNGTMALGLCVEHHCDYSLKELQLILRPYGNGTCEIQCSEYMSNKQMLVPLTDHHCKTHIGEQLPVICPNYTNVCSSQAATPASPPAPSPVSSSVSTPGPGVKGPESSTESSGPAVKGRVHNVVLVLIITGMATL